MVLDGAGGKRIGLSEGSALPGQGLSPWGGTGDRAVGGGHMDSLEASKLRLDFPTLRKECRAKSLHDQALKICEEAAEVVRATGNDVEMARETCDVIQAAQTLLEMLAELGVDIAAAVDWVLEKNRRRGYYSG